MSEEYRPVADVITNRRSVRKFSDEPVDPDVVRELVALACQAPAPHHSRPWRFVQVMSPEAREALADAMGESLTKQEIDALLARRDVIVKLFDDRIAQRSEAAVIYTLPR